MCVLYVYKRADSRPRAAVTLSLAEPLTAWLLGVFFIGEMMTLSSWIGIALMLLGLLVISVSPRKHEPAGSVHVS